MTKAGLKNTKFATILLEEIDSILKRLILVSKGLVLVNRAEKAPIESFEEALTLCCDLFNIIDEKQNQDFYKRFSNILIKEIVDSLELSNFIRFSYPRHLSKKRHLSEHRNNTEYHYALCRRTSL